MAEVQVETKTCSDSELDVSIVEMAERESTVIFLEGPRDCRFVPSLPDDWENRMPEIWLIRVFDDQQELAARRISFGEAGQWRVRVTDATQSGDADPMKSLGMLAAFRMKGEAGSDNIPGQRLEYAEDGFYEDRYRTNESVAGTGEGTFERRPGISYPVDYDECETGSIVELRTAVHALHDGNGDIIRWCGLVPRRDAKAEDTQENENGR